MTRGTHRTAVRFAAALLIALALGSCHSSGGGGGGSNPPPPAPSSNWDQLIWDQGNWV